MNRTHHMRARCGYTLVELTIAMTIFSVVMVAAIQATSALSNYDSLGTAQDDLNNEGKRVLLQVSDDLSRTSWYFPDSLNIAAAPSTVTYPMDVATDVAGIRANMVSDRAMRYYPYVMLQKSDLSANMGLSVGSLFPQHIRTSGLVHLSWPLDPDSVVTRKSLLFQIPGTIDDDLKLWDATITDQADIPSATATYKVAQTAYLQSFYARSQEIVFLLPTSSIWKAKAPRADGLAEADGGSYDYSSDALPAIPNFKGSKNAWRTSGQHEALGIFHPSGWTPVRDASGAITGYNPRPTEPLNSSSASANVEPYGVVMDGGMLQDVSNLQRIGVNWRTVSGAAYAVPPVSDLLEYSYSVIPSQFGLGCLVRTRRVNDATTRKLISAADPNYPQLDRLVSSNGNDGMVVDRILSDNVVRVVFDTYRTVDPIPNVSQVTSLDINQVKVRIYMAKRIATKASAAQGASSNTASSTAKNNASIYRMFETVISMRAQNSGYDKDFNAEAGGANSISAKLGKTPVGIRF